MDNSHCGLRGITDNNQFTNALSVRAASMCDITGRSKVKHLTKPDRLNKKKRAEVNQITLDEVKVKIQAS